MVIYLERGADCLHIAQLMPLPLTVSCFSKMQVGYTFLVPAHPGSSGQRVVKWAYVCMYVCMMVVGVVICLEQGADCLHMVQLMPLHPTTPSCVTE